MLIQQFESEKKTAADRYALLEREKELLNQEIAGRCQQLQLAQDQYVVALKDQAAVRPEHSAHDQLRELISALTRDKEGLSKDLSQLRDANLVLTTRLQDSQLISQGMREQLSKEQMHREELEKLIRIHQKYQTPETPAVQQTNMDQEKRVSELQALLIHQKEESDALIRSHEAIIE